MRSVCDQKTKNNQNSISTVGSLSRTLLSSVLFVINEVDSSVFCRVAGDKKLVSSLEVVVPTGQVFN